MADIDRMFRSELALVAEQHPRSDIWALDSAFALPSPALTLDGDPSNWDTSVDLHTPSLHYQYPPQPETALGLFPDLDRRLGDCSVAGPLAAHPESTVSLSELTLGSTSTTPAAMSVPPIQIPLTAPPSPPLTQSPTDSLVQTDPSSEEMDSDDFELLYPSDSEYLPSPVSIDPATLSAGSTSGVIDPSANVLTHAPAIRPSRRMSRAMSGAPIPIPNLTKKSRGRKVPTSNGGPIYSSSKDKTKKGVRGYTCTADGCGKCFVRGEHLKRHIRSIHTEEKPWECTYQDCNRTFSRRDNLNQHLRTHKLQDNDD